MQLSTLKLLFLSLLVSLSTAATAQTTKKTGDGTKENPYSVMELTSNEAKWMELMEKGEELYIVDRFVGFGADGKTAADEGQASGFVFPLRDAFQDYGNGELPSEDAAAEKANEDGESTGGTATSIVAAGKDVLEKLHKLEPKAWYIWKGSFQLLEEVGDFVFNVTEIFDAPTSVNRVAAPSFAQKAVYDLSGRLVQTQFEPSTLPQGLYIVGGKKVFVR